MEKNKKCVAILKNGEKCKYLALLGEYCVQHYCKENNMKNRKRNEQYKSNKFYKFKMDIEKKKDNNRKLYKEQIKEQN